MRHISNPVYVYIYVKSHMRNSKKKNQKESNVKLSRNNPLWNCLYTLMYIFKI